MEKIIVKHKTQEKVNGRWKDVQVYPDATITLKQFEDSFVNERWSGEIRYNKQYTKLGYFHTKTVVNRDSNYRSIREFVFPD